jgi:hypothetical protein
MRVGGHSLLTSGASVDNQDLKTFPRFIKSGQRAWGLSSDLTVRSPMQLTDRFLDFADQQLNPVVSLKRHSRTWGCTSARHRISRGPRTCCLIRQWSPIEPHLAGSRRGPGTQASPVKSRRWYPLQDAGLILGALRAELAPGLNWTADSRTRGDAPMLPSRSATPWGATWSACSSPGRASPATQSTAAPWCTSCATPWRPCAPTPSC